MSSLIDKHHPEERSGLIHGSMIVGNARLDSLNLGFQHGISKHSHTIIERMSPSTSVDVSIATLTIIKSRGQTAFPVLLWGV